MARKKKPENETPEQARQRRIFETIANKANRSEKTSWNRKMDNMVKLLAKLRPIEDKIVELQAQKIPIFDEVQELREEMLQVCIHPQEYLVMEGDHVICKFCTRKINIQDGVKQKL